jgi:sporulation protein YlmC with PRC-barrel domain
LQALQGEYIVDRDDRLRELEERYEDYEVYDTAGEKIGKVDDLFIDETQREEYIGVKMGLFGLSGKTLIPMETARVDDRERRIEVVAPKDHVKDAPHYSDDDDLDHEFEARIRDHFGLEGGELLPERGTYGRYVGATVGEGSDISGAATGTTSPRSIEDPDLIGRETYQDREDLGGPTGATSTGPLEERTTRRDFDEPLEAPPMGAPGDADLLGGQHERTAGAPEVGGAGERHAPDPLEPREEARDVPLDRPTEGMRGEGGVQIRVRRVRTEREDRM